MSKKIDISKPLTIHNIPTLSYKFKPIRKVYGNHTTADNQILTDIEIVDEKFIIYQNHQMCLVDRHLVCQSKFYDKIDIPRLSCNMVPIELNGKVGYMDTDGNEIIPPIYTDGSIFDSYGICRVIKDDKIIMLDLSGNEISMDNYTKFMGTSGFSIEEAIDNYNSMIARFIVHSDKNKYISDTYKVVSGLLMVKHADTHKYGFCDINGQLVIDCIYDDVTSSGFDYDHNRTIVYKDGLCGMINTKGEIEIPIIYELILAHSSKDNPLLKNQYIVKSPSGKFGCIGIESGEISYPMIFESKRKLIKSLEKDIKNGKTSS